MSRLKPLIKSFRNVVVIIIVVSWVLSGWPVIWQNPLIPLGIQEALAADWYNSNWSFRKKITIDNTKVTADLTNFPVLISLTSDTGLAANAQADGDDILFTSSDGTTKLSHEIERYTSATGALVAWVKVPSLANSTDTELYMYYGNAAATSQQDATNVWDSNYKGVWHLKEMSGTSMTDSTSNANTGTRTAATEPNPVTGQINGAQDFDGTNDRIVAAKTSSLDITGTAITMSAWVSTPGHASWRWGALRRYREE